MAVLTDVVEGWTGAIPVICKADLVAVDLTGLTVTAAIKDRFGVPVLTSGAITVTDTTGGEVTWMPSSSDLARARSPYSVRIKVTDLSGDVVWFPNGEPDTIVVFTE